MPAYSVVLFYSTAHAIRAEKVLQQAGLEVKMIPTPRHLSSNCGVALRFDRAQEEQVVSILTGNGVPTDGLYPL